MCKKQKTLFLVNFKNPNEIMTVDNWVENDNELYVFASDTGIYQDKYLATEYAWFYSLEYAQQVIEDMKKFSYVELENFTEYGTTIYFNNDEEVIYLYYGTPVAHCEYCDRFLVKDEIHYMDNDDRDEVCADCFEKCDWCSLCGRVMDEEDIQHYDGYCSDCY